MMTSPSAAKLAATPPVVGCARIEMKGSPASRSSSTAATVLAICISASTPSCMRAPPEDAADTSGIRSATAASAARANFSTTEPMLPPMKVKSITESATLRSPIDAVPTSTASAGAVPSSAAASRSG